MSNHIICRATGERVGRGYLLTIMRQGHFYRFYNERAQQNEFLSKADFDKRYLIEKVEYKAYQDNQETGEVSAG